MTSSGARRLRAEGLGVTLHASAGDEIAQWYLNPRGDIRSSYALEVPANEYTCQGLELDFACVCWGGTSSGAIPRGSGPSLVSQELRGNVFGIRLPSDLWKTLIEYC